MRDRPDNLSAAADGIKWQLVSLALMFATLYLLRMLVLDAREEIEQARHEKAKAKIDLDRALEALHAAQNGDDEPPAGE